MSRSVQLEVILFNFVEDVKVKHSECSQVFMHIYANIYLYAVYMERERERKR